MENNIYLMVSKFYIKENHLSVLKTFIDKNLFSSKFKFKPLNEFGKLYIVLSLNLKDYTKLSNYLIINKL